MRTAADGLHQDQMCCLVYVYSEHILVCHSSFPLSAENKQPSPFLRRYTDERASIHSLFCSAKHVLPIFDGVNSYPCFRRKRGTGQGDFPVEIDQLDEWHFKQSMPTKNSQLLLGQGAQTRWTASNHLRDLAKLMEDNRWWVLCRWRTYTTNTTNAIVTCK